MTLKVAIAIYEHDQWENHMLMDNYKLFPKSPSSSSIASASSSNGSGSSYHSMESGISSMSPECPSDHTSNCTPPNFEPLTISALEKEKIKRVFQTRNLNFQRDSSKAILSNKSDTKIIYQGRNLLDLGSNIRMGWKIPVTELSPGMNNYFENRSQYSRIHEAFPPPHKNYPCSDEDCSFVIPIYY